MYAIIKTGGKQYRVSVGDMVDVELLNDTDQGANVAFGEVLFFFDGSATKIGQPHIPDFQVFGEVIGVVKGDKITTLKYKRSHNQYRKWGHRQKYTRIKITGIGNQNKEGNHGS